MVQADSRRRRHLLTAAVGLAAGAAGAGLALWRLQPDSKASSTAADADLWSKSFATPGGSQLVMQSLRGRPLLLNFWATWCPPCVEEMPMLDRFWRDQAPNRWQVVGLAIDQPSSVRKFLAATPVSFPIGLAGLEGTDLGKALGNSAGGLPFTVVFASDGRVRERRMGKVSEADLARWRTAS